MSKYRILGWVLCLASLSVGLKNFEVGLTTDAPLYAAIARNSNLTHEWFHLEAGIPELSPFFEHPHLGFWVLSAVYKVLPTADWSGRLVGIFFYVAFLFIFFLFVRRYSGEKTAAITLFILWIWARFSNFFSNIYLDPGALFFGAGAIFLLGSGTRTGLAALAGVSVALCALYKGLTVLGFFPAYLFLLAQRRDYKAMLFFVLGLSAVLGLYWLAMASSNQPDFLARYWARQVEQRFSHTWNIWGLVSPSFWATLARDSYYLAPLAFLGWKRVPWVAKVCFFSFVFLYAPVDRIGSQYQLMLLPWLAWSIAEGISPCISVSTLKLTRFTGAIALIGLAVVQLFPVPTHGGAPSPEELAVAFLRRQKKITTVHLDAFPSVADFTVSARFAWYGDVTVTKSLDGAVPQASPHVGYLLMANLPDRETELSRLQWCLYARYPREMSLWLKCS